MHAAAQHRQFFVGVSQDGIEGAGIGFARRCQGRLCRRLSLTTSSATPATSARSPAEARGLNDPPGAPWLDILQLFGKAGCIGCRGEGFMAQNGRSLVLAVAIARRAAESANDHVGPVAPDHPNHIRKNAVVTPFLQSFSRGPGETEVDGAGEELFGSIDLARGQQFLRADDAALRASLLTDQ